MTKEFIGERKVGSIVGILNSGTLPLDLNDLQKDNDVVVTNKKGEVLTVLFSENPTLPDGSEPIEVVVNPDDLV